MELRTIEQDRAKWRIEEVQGRMVRHSKAITSAYDFPDCLFVKEDTLRHHIKMLWMLNHGLTMLQHRL